MWKLVVGIIIVEAEDIVNNWHQASAQMLACICSSLIISSNQHAGLSAKVVIQLLIKEGEVLVPADYPTRLLCVHPVVGMNSILRVQVAQ